MACKSAEWALFEDAMRYAHDMPAGLAVMSALAMVIQPTCLLIKEWTVPQVESQPRIPQQLHVQVAVCTIAVRLLGGNTTIAPSPDKSTPCGAFTEGHATNTDCASAYEACSREQAKF